MSGCPRRLPQSGVSGISIVSNVYEANLVILLQLLGGDSDGDRERRVVIPDYQILDKALNATCQQAIQWRMPDNDRAWMN